MSFPDNQDQKIECMTQRSRMVFNALYRGQRKVIYTNYGEISPGTVFLENLRFIASKKWQKEIFEVLFLLFYREHLVESYQVLKAMVLENQEIVFKDFFEKLLIRFKTKEQYQLALNCILDLSDGQEQIDGMNLLYQASDDSYLFQDPLKATLEQMMKGNQRTLALAIIDGLLNPQLKSELERSLVMVKGFDSLCLDEK